MSHRILIEEVNAKLREVEEFLAQLEANGEISPLTEEDKRKIELESKIQLVNFNAIRYAFAKVVEEHSPKMKYLKMEGKISI